MAIFSWKPLYSVGVTSCDVEHQSLFECLDRLHDAMRVAQGAGITEEIVAELELYTRTHFRAEEALMRNTKYPGLEAHCAQHKIFEDNISSFKASLKTQTGCNPVDVSVFLNDWLTRHILRNDKKYEDHMHAAGIK